MDRALVSGTKGRGFEPRIAYHPSLSHLKPTLLVVNFLFSYRQVWKKEKPCFDLFPNQGLPSQAPKRTARISFGEMTPPLNNFPLKVFEDLFP
jgi:hypothetical protein